MSLRPSSKVSSVTQSPTLSTPSARPSPPSMSSTHSSAKAVPFTVSVAKFSLFSPHHLRPPSHYLSILQSTLLAFRKCGYRWAYVTFDSLIARRSSMLFTAGFRSSPMSIFSSRQILEHRSVAQPSSHSHLRS